MAWSLLEGGSELLVVTPRPSPLRHLAGTPGVLGVLTGTPSEADVYGLLDQALGPVAVLVDDGELLVDAPCAAAFEAVLREGRDGQRALVVGGTTGEMVNGYRGYIVEARKTKSGVLLNPEHPMEGELLGIKPPRSAVGPMPKGRGLLVLRGSYLPVQVPLADALAQAGDPFVGLAQALRVGSVEPGGAGRADADEAGLAQHPQVLGDGRLGDPELGLHDRAERARGPLGAGEQLEQPPPHRIPQHVEHVHPRTVRRPDPRTWREPEVHPDGRRWVR